MEHILAERDASVLCITLNRPEKLNAFVGTMREDILDVLTDAEHDSEVRAVLFTGAGRAFCAGGDVRYMHELRKRNDVTDFGRILDAANAVARLVYEFPKPTIAAVNGIAAGGGANLALACDVRIGAASCAFVQSFIKIGLGPDWGGSFLLPRIVGTDRALELLLTGRTVDSAEALQLGLIHQMVETDDLSEHARAVGSQLGAWSPQAVVAIKNLIRRTPPTSLCDALEMERSSQIRCFLSDHAGAAFARFAGKPNATKRD